MILDSPNSIPSKLKSIELADVIDIPALQKLVNYHVGLTGIAVGILDLKGNVLVGAGWQEICTKYHRATPESCQNCNQSDTLLSAGVAPGTFKAYRCKNNMWDVATPLMVSNQHLGNIFIGQFLYDDEVHNYELFRAQAKHFGFDEESYIESLEKVPRYSREFVADAMKFYTNLAQLVSRPNYDNVLLKNSAHELEQLNRTLKASTNSMQAIMKAKCETEYLKEVCRIIVEDCGHSMVWIGQKDNDENKTIRPVASAGFDNGYLEALNLTWGDSQRGSGPAAQAIRSGEMYVCKSIEADPNFETWRNDALARGYASLVSLPLKTNDLSFGSLNIYSKMPDAFAEAELKLLSELTERLSFGIEALRLRAEAEKSSLALKQKELDLRSALTARDEFISIASHELRTPLTSLRLQLAMLFRSLKKQPEQVEAKLTSMCERAINAELHLGRLVDELLDITHIRVGKIKLSKQEMELTSKIKEVISRMSDNINRSDCTIKFSAPEPILGFWDPTRIDQIVTNIISNAIKYGEGKPIEVNLFTTPDTKMAIIKILDFGIGISSELQAKIFERFERGHSHTNISGLGLGLYIVRQLIEAHGGSIRVESNPGIGSLFTIELPLEVEKI